MTGAFDCISGRGATDGLSPRTTAPADCGADCGTDGRCGAIGLADITGFFAGLLGSCAGRFAGTGGRAGVLVPSPLSLDGTPTSDKSNRTSLGLFGVVGFGGILMSALEGVFRGDETCALISDFSSCLSCCVLATSAALAGCGGLDGARSLCCCC